MLSKLFGGTMPSLERTLDLTELRQKLISSNIANEETPGYKAMDISFEKELKRSLGNSAGGGINSEGDLQLAVTSSGHISMNSSSGNAPSLSTEAVITLNEGEGLDGNTVNLEHEMVKMAENSVRHQTALTLLAKKFQGLKGAIDERR